MAKQLIILAMASRCRASSRETVMPRPPSIYQYTCSLGRQQSRTEGCDREEGAVYLLG